MSSEGTVVIETRINVSDFKNIIKCSYKTIGGIKKVKWKTLRPKASMVIISVEDYQMISSAYLSVIVDSIITLQNQDFTQLNTHSPAINCFPTISDCLAKTIDVLKNFLIQNGSKASRQENTVSVGVESIMMLTKDVDKMKRIWLTVLPIYKKYFVKINFWNYSSKEQWGGIAAKTQELIILGKSALSKLIIPDEQSYKGKIRKLELDEDKSEKRSKLDTCYLGGATEENMLGTQLLEIRKNFSFINSNPKKFQSFKIRPMSNFPYIVVSRMDLALVSTDYLPSLRNQIISLRDCFELRNFSCLSGKVYNSRLIVKHPELIDAQLKKIFGGLNSLIYHSEARDITVTDQVIIHRSQVRSTALEVTDIQTQWLFLSNHYDKLLSTINTDSMGQLTISDSIWDCTVLKVSEILEKIDLAIKHITCFDEVEFEKRYRFIGHRFGDMIKINIKCIKSIVDEKNNDVVKTSSCDDPGNINGESGSDNGGGGIKRKDGLEYEEHCEDLEECHKVNFLKSWNEVLILLESIIFKISQKKNPMKATTNLNRSQIILLGYEFQLWALDYKVTWDGDGWGVSSHVDFVETISELLKLIGLIRDTFFVKNTEIERTYKIDERLSFDEYIGEIEVDLNDEDQVWIRSWLDKIIRAVEKVYLADKLYWDKH
ncbi:hypothetical protein BY996DRAFT_2887183 [Phakopsora pachyrhizi]|nr:hypothetical protein BY996DRAFT_2887183 [Phakopsora pachyrhizi]